MAAYYNEHDPNAAAWLRELIRADLIAPGDVDERDIRDVVPTELARYRQCHFFAGIGVWSYALRQTGWPDDRPVWTGSCPCQSFSAAGKRAGFADQRHLWPSWFHLISQCRPPTIFGEQVAADDAHPWLDLVHTDLEALGYAIGPVVLPAAGFGAPHGRHRIFFVADTVGLRRRNETPEARNGPTALGRSTDLLADTGQSRRESTQREKPCIPVMPCSPVNLMGDPGGPRLEGRSGESGDDGGQQPTAERAGGATGDMGNTDGERPANDSILRRRITQESRTGPTNGFWADADWLHCRPEPGYPEGRWRAVEPGTFPLVASTAQGMVRSGDSSLSVNATAEARSMRLRGYGNAINAEVAKAFIEAYMSLTDP